MNSIHEKGVGVELCTLDIRKVIFISYSIGYILTAVADDCIAGRGDGGELMRYVQEVAFVAFASVADGHIIIVIDSTFRDGVLAAIVIW